MPEGFDYAPYNFIQGQTAAGAVHLSRSNITSFISRLWRATDGGKLDKINCIAQTLVIAFIPRYLSIVSC